VLCTHFFFMTLEVLFVVLFVLFFFSPFFQAPVGVRFFPRLGVAFGVALAMVRRWVFIFYSFLSFRFCFVLFFFSLNSVRFVFFRSAVLL